MQLQRIAKIAPLSLTLGQRTQGRVARQPVSGNFQQLQRAVAAEHHTAFSIQPHHALVNVLQSHLQGFFGTGLAGDVFQRALHPQRLALGIAHQAGVLAHPDAFAVAKAKQVGFQIPHHAAVMQLHHQGRMPPRRALPGGARLGHGLA